MANEPQLTDSRIAEIRGLIESEADEDRAQLPSVALELLAEVERLHLRVASQDAHIAVIGAELLKQ